MQPCPVPHSLPGWALGWKAVGCFAEELRLGQTPGTEQSQSRSGRAVPGELAAEGTGGTGKAPLLGLEEGVLA